MIDDIGITNDRVNLLWIGASKPIRPRQIFKNQEDLGMINGKSLFTAGLLASGLVLTSSPLFAADGTFTPGEKHELGHDRREIHGDHKEIHSDRKDLRGDRRELVRDRHELHQDLKGGAGKAEIAHDVKEIHQDRKEIVHDKVDLAKDVKETNGDRRELRQDRREFRRDAKDALKN